MVPAALPRNVSLLDAHSLEYQAYVLAHHPPLLPPGALVFNFPEIDAEHQILSASRHLPPSIMVEQCF